MVIITSHHDATRTTVSKDKGPKRFVAGQTSYDSYE